MGEWVLKLNANPTGLHGETSELLYNLRLPRVTILSLQKRFCLNEKVHFGSVFTYKLNYNLDISLQSLPRGELTLGSVNTTA